MSASQPSMGSESQNDSARWRSPLHHCAAALSTAMHASASGSSRRHPGAVGPSGRGPPSPGAPPARLPAFSASQQSTTTVSRTSRAVKCSITAGRRSAAALGSCGMTSCRRVLLKAGRNNRLGANPEMRSASSGASADPSSRVSTASNERGRCCSCWWSEPAEWKSVSKSTSCSCSCFSPGPHRDRQRCRLVAYPPAPSP
mmetsp:Transcript_17920/g.53948  ORF Transcript_17920/g.53948 Transcript_17920/m.53948 type:complete len:200 (+) Transcript_17920:2074-2673(+)